MAYVVVDTNVMMHFAFVQDYPFRAHPELADQYLSVMIVRPVLEELDNHKGRHKDVAIRKRCGAQLRWLEEMFPMEDSIIIGDRIHLRVDLTRPYRQSDESTDDRILRYCDEYSPQVYLLSDDTSMRMKARFRHQFALEPIRPDSISVDEQ